MKLRTKKRLSDMANYLAIAVALALISCIFMPKVKYGGSITLVSCLPVLVLSYRHGVKRALPCAAVFMLLQMGLNFETVKAVFEADLFPGGGVMLVVLDYVVPYMALALGGLFRSKSMARKKSFPLGCLLAMGIRYFSHFLCRLVVLGSLAEAFFERTGAPDWSVALAKNADPQLLPLLFAMICTSLYMLPELVLTVGSAWLLSDVRKIVKRVHY